MTSNHEILGSTPSVSIFCLISTINPGNCSIQSLDKVFTPLSPTHTGTQEKFMIKLPIIRSHGLVVKRMTSNHEILGSTPSVSIFCFSLVLRPYQRDGCLG
ncbi:hypothetical protein N7527_006676 [Penicillium freii]|nr:hypothetical protein N7527_006676 [Penicillium freii]